MSIDDFVVTRRILTKHALAACYHASDVAGLIEPATSSMLIGLTDYLKILAVITNA